MAILSYLIPIQVAFKLVTFLAIVSIPFGAYLFLKLLRFSRLVSITGAIFTLPFLFMESQSMWGGNILSTFAGEFTYALGIALSFVYLGLLHEGIQTKKHLIKNSILLASIGFSHVYTLLWVIITSLFLLYSPDFKKRFAYWMQVNAIGFLLLGFWILPLLYHVGFASSHAMIWIFGSWQEFFPMMLWPFSVIAAGGAGLAIVRREKRVFYLLFSAALSLIFYFLSKYIGLTDIRFIPFVQLSLLLAAAYAFTSVYEVKLRGVSLIPIIILLLTLLWVQTNSNVVTGWAEWNYKGFEDKRLWPQYSAVNDFLKGSENDPRVFYQHSPKHNPAGTTRVYELLPYFSGRSTLEGLYKESTATSPFVYYIQSETTETPSCPVPHKKCTSFNLSTGTEHLKLFNVQHFIAITDEVKSALRNHSEYELVFEKQPYEVFELKTNENNYVTIPKYKPVVFPQKGWQNRSYELFKNDYYVPVIFDKSVKEEPELVRQPLNLSCNITTTVKQEEVLFTTDCVGAPHLVKISYFPRWKSEGGEKIHLVSPSFMLIYPEKEQVRLYFGRTWVENGSLMLSILGWILVVGYRPLARKLGKKSPVLKRFLFSGDEVRKRLVQK